MKTSAKKIKRFALVAVLVLSIAGACIAAYLYYQNYMKVADTSYFDDRYQVVANGVGQRGLREVRTGEMVVGFDYEDIQPALYFDLFEAQKDGKWGLMSKKTFEPLTPFKYNVFYSFDYTVPLVAARSGDTVYFLDTLGMEQPFRFYSGRNINDEDYISFDDFGLCIVPIIQEEDRRYILIDRTGNPLPCGPFADIQAYPYVRDGKGSWCGYYAVESLDGGWCVIDTLGNPVLPCHYSEVSIMDQHGFIVLQDDKRVLLDFDQQVVDVTLFDEVEDNGEEFSKVYVNGRVGMVDSKGKVVIAPRWDDVYCYRGRVFCASMDGYEFFLDDKDRFVKTP